VDVRGPVPERFISMKTYLFPLVSAMAVTVLLSAPAIAAPPLEGPAPIITNTDHPSLAPIEGTVGQTDTETPNAGSLTGSVKNMAPVRGKPRPEELIKPGESASGLTIPGASSGSSLGSGSNSTLGPKTEPEENLDPDSD
jgi:hypothetical protein